MHCRAEHSSKGGENPAASLHTIFYLHARHGSYAHDKMILQKITTTICNLEKTSFSVLIAGEASRAQTHWRRHRGLGTGHGGANRGRKPSGIKYNKMFRQSVGLDLSCWIRVKFQDSLLWYFSQIRKIFTIERTCPFSWKQNCIWSRIEFPFSKNMDIDTY